MRFDFPRLLILCLLAGLTAAAPSFAKDVKKLPRILGDEDRKLYRQIFAAQAKGDWDAADGRIKKLKNNILMGQVLFERYMVPEGYISRYAELAAWLRAYGDHAEADRVYQLALRKRPGPSTYPKPPSRRLAIKGFKGPRPKKRSRTNGYSRPKKGPAAARDAKIRKLVRQRKPQEAEKLLYKVDSRELLSTAQFDAAKAQVAAGYFYTNDDAKAYKIAAAAAKRSRKVMYWPDWIAGLAAWRSYKPRLAARHFQLVDKSPVAGDWVKAGAAFWAARAHLAGGNAAQVRLWLGRASRFPKTFYGLIAHQILGIAPPLNWARPRLPRADLKRLMGSNAVRRAIALTEVGEIATAELELERVYWASGSASGKAMLGLAQHLNLPGFSFRIARRFRGVKNMALDRALYPIPPWKPKKGFTVDRALVYAFMRKESHFEPLATSPAGARGLMQLMPTTARYIAGDKELDLKKLYEPVYNIALGQKYLRYLMSYDIVGGDPLRLAVAYNAGPGNLVNWRKGIDHHNEPLLFAESLPSTETRIFVEEVLANYWIYRYRLKRPVVSLKQVAAGLWPKIASPKTTRKLARNK